MQVLQQQVENLAHIAHDSEFKYQFDGDLLIQASLV